MSNPLQPKCLKVIREEYKGYAVNIVSSLNGDMDILACVAGLFYGFEIKWKSDQPSELQKQKINDCIDAGGRAYFIRSVEDIHDVLFHGKPPIRYKLKNHVTL